MRKYTTTVLLLMALSLSACSSSSNDPIQDDDPDSIDRDNDGVRDDVQSAITDRYPDDERKKKALMQFALGIQHSLDAVSSTGSGNINDTFQEIVDAADCITAVSSNAFEDVVFIEALMIDDPEKSQLYDEFNDQASGNFFGGSTNFEDGCR